MVFVCVVLGVFAFTLLLVCPFDVALHKQVEIICHNSPKLPSCHPTVRSVSGYNLQQSQCGVSVIQPLVAEPHLSYTNSSSVLKQCVLAVFFGLTRRVAKYSRSAVSDRHNKRDKTHRLHPDMSFREAQAVFITHQPVFTKQTSFDKYFKIR